MSIGNVTIRQLQDSIEAHRRLLSAANQKAEEAQGQLIRIGLDYCGQQFDHLQKNGLVLETASPEILGDLISNSLKITLTGVDHQSLNWPERLNELNRRVESLQKEVDLQTRRANQAEEKLLQLQKQASSLDQSLISERMKKEKVPVVETPKMSVDKQTEWFQLWRKKKGFERDKLIVLLIGEAGYSRRSEIHKIVVQKFGLGERAAYRGVEACQDEELITTRSGVSVQGRPTDLVFLAEKGRWAYTKLTGKSPVPGELEMLLKSHKSERHTSLILKTADYFTALGFLVERQPVEIKIGSDRFFQPDLVVSKDSETFYLEVETGEREDRTSLVHKWENAYIVGAGRLCIVTPRLGVMNTAQSMILNWATENGKKPNLYLTHLDALKKCKQGDSPWVRIR
ncbi:MAG: hypothetical protein JNM55_21195 [Anaerolineales bacterium]|nr:hypothetical protein [Anaerolineales bacterium]